MIRAIRPTGRKKGQQNSTWENIYNGTIKSLKEYCKGEDLNIFSSYITEKARIMLLKCRLASNCSYSLRIVDYFNSDVKALEMENGRNQHTHTMEEDNLNRIFHEDYIKELFENDASPTQIFNRFADRNPSFNVKNYKQFLNFIAQRKVRYLAKVLQDYSSLDTNQMRQFISHLNLNFTSFVPHSINDTPDRFVYIPKFKIGTGEEKDPLYIILTSEVLLKNLILQNQKADSIICCDGTYKLNSQRFPLLVMGTLGKDRTFSLVAVCLSSTESKEAYKFFLEGIKEEIKKRFGVNYKLKVGLSDGADAICSAFDEVYHSDMQLMILCYFHFKRNLDRRLKKSRINIEIRKKIFEQVETLRICTSKSQFDILWGLIKKKWLDDGLNEFVVYFQSEYINSKKKTWSFAFNPTGLPCTNNALEAFNKSIKYHQTYRIRPEMPKFLKFIVELIYNKSRLTYIFPDSPLIPNNVWDPASEMSRDDFYQGQRALFYCLITPSPNKKITRGEAAEYRAFQSTSIEQLKTLLTSIASVNPEKKICSCVMFLTKNYCIHLYGYLLAFGLVEKPKKLVKKAKRGKKRKTNPVESEEAEENSIPLLKKAKENEKLKKSEPKVKVQLTKSKKGRKQKL